MNNQNTLHIESEPMNDRFTKFHVKGMPIDAVIHRFTLAAPEPYHDHPYAFTSQILAGGYIEEIITIETGLVITRHRKVGDTIHNQAGTIHRIIDLPDGECWTFITPQSKERDSGFYEFRADGVYHRFWHEPDFVPYDAARFEVKP